MPKLAMGMNEGIVVEWLVSEGQQVERGAPLMQVETEKVAYDVEAPVAGWFHILVPAGETVPVESVIGQFAASAEEYAEIAGAAAPRGTTASTPAMVFDDKLTSTGAVMGTVPAAAATAAGGGRIKASPLARKLARDRGIDLATLAGTGPEGRIVKRDVLAAEAVAQASTAAAPPSATGELSVKGTVPLKGMRGAIARRMTQSLQTSAQLSHFSEVDATGLLKARKSFIADADAYGTRVSVNAFVVKAIALACQAVPIANSAIVDDQIVLWNEVNVGIAVSLPGQGEWDSGLIVPVLRNAERKGLVQIDTELRDLATRAREGRLVPGETEGGTITLSPTAAMGGEAMYSWSTPVLNLPQALIVQPGMIMPRAVVHKGKIKQREMMPLSVTFDHRILDGDPVASFVVRLRRCLQAPELMLA
ncbi:MAG: 2-oxo acid dehydrogenase subunit E2 [Pseudomonadales bacterium]|nr:2-oxo acid dehydrogenase subunit E2 [Pseudomonadales bacterium]